MRRHPDSRPSRRPAGTRVNTVTVDCGRSGPEELDCEGSPYRRHAVADAEAWCAELRRPGAPDDLVLPEADGLIVTMNVRS